VGRLMGPGHRALTGGSLTLQDPLAPTAGVPHTECDLTRDRRAR